jgi:DNA (cytosine-5)-methyltransferase 1
MLSLDSARPLSLRATSGFWSRLQKTNLGRYPGFRDALVEHIDHCGAPEETSAA